MLASLGFTPKDLRVKINHRAALAEWFNRRGVPAAEHAKILTLLDQKGKMPPGDFAHKLAQFGFTPDMADVFQKGIIRVELPAGAGGVSVMGQEVTRDEVGGGGHADPVDLTFFAEAVRPLALELAAAGVIDWVDFDLSIVRGLAYYTGMVFEVHEASGSERAVAGGGRYDNLIELFGGPPTPAVGMGMGDVVLALVMKDKGLMPDESGLLERAGMRPDVFVISNGTPGAEQQLRPLVASLRRAGLHARHTYKTTRNVGKLLKEAADQRAHVAVIIENESTCSVKVLATGAQHQTPIAEAVGHVRLARTVVSPNVC